MAKLLEVNHLTTQFKVDKNKIISAVDNSSFFIDEGETLAIVGESGSGKSVTALSVMQLVPNPPGLIAGGEIMFRGRDLLKLSKAEMRSVRGIYKDPRAVTVRDVRNRADIADHSLISRRGQDNELRSRVFFERLFNRFGLNGIIKAEFFIRRRKNIDGFYGAELNGVINRFMAVAHHNDGIARTGHCPDGGGYARG